MNRRAGLAASLDHLPPRVWCRITITVTIGAAITIVATVLNAGIQTGSGALLAMPTHPPNRITSQKTSSAEYRLCRSLRVSLGMK